VGPAKKDGHEILNWGLSVKKKKVQKGSKKKKAMRHQKRNSMR